MFRKKNKKTEEIEVMDGVFKRLFSYIKPYRMRFIWSVVFGVLAGIIYGLLMWVMNDVFEIILDKNATTIHPFKSVPFESAKNYSVTLPAKGSSGRLWIILSICLSLPIVFALQGVLRFFHRYFILWINNKVLYTLRDECFTSMIKQSVGFFNQAKQGELMHSVSAQTRACSDAGMQALSAWVQHPIAILSCLIFCFVKDPLYTLGALVVFPLCILPVILIARRVRKAGSREEVQAEALMVSMQESFDGIRLVKAHAREEFQRDRFNKNSSQLLAWLLKWKKDMEISTPLVEIVAAAGISVGLAYSYLKEDMSPATFMTINVAMIAMYGPVKALSRLHIQLQRCAISASRVFGYIDREAEVLDSKNAVELEKVDGPFELVNLKFAYDPSTPVIKDLSLTFEPGKKYALVGQSGSGKSTLLSLMLRFYDPQSGEIRLAGRDIRDYTQESLRDQIGFVSQSVFHFHDTIRANIRYGELDATDEEIEKAAEQSYCREFIDQLPDGFETMLGDKGQTLSGGQQQRLSIARAILRDAPILFLDEAMSALDTESEKKVQQAIDTLVEGKMVIAIAHRLSTILDSDEIIVMKEGQVVGQGPHQELLKENSEYKKLYDLQFNVD